MLIKNFFSLLSLLLVTTYGLPTRKLDDTNQNAIISISANENSTPDHPVGNTEIKHPVIQSKPRIVVSYGNVYKQPPVEPVQNLLMYFLMNVARDFAQDQDQFEKRRSPNFLSDAKSTVTEVGGKIINGSKRFGQKIGDAFKSINSRDVGLQPQYEEPHYYPHIDGTCMCFNRLIRHGSDDVKNEHVKENFLDYGIKENVELTTEKRSKEATDGQPKTDKTTELKPETHVVSDAKEKSTVTVAGNEDVNKVNNTIVRVLKVMDLDSLETNKVTAETTIEPKSELEPKVGEDLIMELRAVPQDETKVNPTQEYCKRPPMPDNTKLTKKETPGINKIQPHEDEGYYFLLVSGGTDKRTTAPELKPREQSTVHHYKNLLPKYEDKLLRLREAKRKRRRFKRHHHGSNNKSSLDEKYHKKKLEEWRENIRKQIQIHKREGDFFSIDDKSEAEKPKMIGSDLSSLMLYNAFETEGAKPQLRTEEKEPPTQQTMLLTMTLPTFVGGGLFLLGLCYFLRAKGWCCRLFLDKSNIVVVDVNEQNKTEQTTQ